MSYTQDFFNWECSDVCNWLHSRNLKNYIENFRIAQVNGYDLCHLSIDELKSELKINNYHDRLLIIKEIRKLIVENLKLIICYDNEKYELCLDFDKSTMLIDMIGYISNLIKLSDDKIIILDSKNEILSPNVRIAEMIIIDPNRYKTLTIVTKFSDIKVKKDDKFKYTSSYKSNNYKDEYIRTIDATPKYDTEELLDSDQGRYKINKPENYEKYNYHEKDSPKRIYQNEAEDNSKKFTKDNDNDYNYKSKFQSEKRIYREVKGRPISTSLENRDTYKNYNGYDNYKNYKTSDKSLKMGKEDYNKYKTNYDDYRVYSKSNI